MKQNPKIEDAVEVGVMIGQQHAFGLVAGRCSAASAEYLRRIRNEKKYRSLGLTWQEFCAKRLGISRPSADKIIRQLEELGPGYFALSQVTRIAPEEYRRIAASVSENALTHGGEVIAISAENTPRLAAAIDDLRRAAEAAAPPAAAEEPDLEHAFRKAARALQTAAEEFEHLNARQLDIGGRLRLQSLLGAGLGRLQLVQMSVRI
jgi:DNA-binding MarR family transcriptional regulator